MAVACPPRALCFALALSLRGRQGFALIFTRLPLTMWYFGFGFFTGQSRSFGFLCAGGLGVATGVAEAAAGTATGGARPPRATMNAAPAPAPAPGAATSASGPAPASAEPAASALPVCAPAPNGAMRTVAAPLTRYAAPASDSSPGAPASMSARPVAVDVSRCRERRAQATARLGPSMRRSGGETARSRTVVPRWPGTTTISPAFVRPSGEAADAPIAMSGMPSPFWSPTPASDEPSPSPAFAPSMRYPCAAVSW